MIGFARIVLTDIESARAIASRFGCAAELTLDPDFGRGAIALESEASLHPDSFVRNGVKSSGAKKNKENAEYSEELRNRGRHKLSLRDGKQWFGFGRSGDTTELEKGFSV